MNAKWISSVCLLSALALGSAAGAQTVTLPASADTFLRSGSANQNRGAEPVLSLSNDQRVLLSFDPAAISAAVGSGRLVSASLELFVHATNGSWGSAGHPVEAHLVTAGWSEGGATWNCPNDGLPGNGRPDCAERWDGGTFASEASDEILQTREEGRWIRIDVTADVEARLSGAPGFGWLLLKPENAGSGRADYGSREGAAGERPRLVLLVETAAHDTVPPTLAITAPAGPVVVNDPAPAIAIEFRDFGSGVDPASLEVKVDGVAATASCTVSGAGAACRAPALAAGLHSVTVALRDRAGNAAQAGATFRLLLGAGPHTVTLPAVADTYLRRGAANRNQGGEPILRLKQGGDNRALVRVDPAALASALNGATLVSAALQLHVEENGRNWGSAGRTVDAHRLTAAWSETGATWNCANDSNPTNSKADCAAPWAGGSFAAAPTATVLHTRELSGWVSYDVTPDVASLEGGAPNLGWVIKKSDENRSGRVEYDSREGTAEEGPRLVLVLTTPTGGDSEPPILSSLLPFDGSLVASSAPGIAANYSDADSGVALATVRVRLDGADRTAEAVIDGVGVTLVPVPPLAEGAHLAAFELADQAGNRAVAETRFTVDTVPPEVAVTEPSVSERLAGEALAIRVEYSDGGSGIDPALVRIDVDGADVTGACSLGAAAATCSVPDPGPGGHRISARAADRAGNASAAAAAVTLLADGEAPALAISEPAAPLIRGGALPAVRVDYADPLSGLDLASLAIALDGADLTAGCQVGAAFATCPPRTLPPGAHRLSARIADRRGNLAEAARELILVVPVEIAISTPAPDQLLGVPVVRIEGTISANVQSVRVNGLAATLGSGTFSLDALGLHDGVNQLVAVAEDGAGNTGAASVRVIADTTPPALSITSPAAGAVLSEPRADVAGLVNDLTLGTVSETRVTLTVNGIPAAVLNRSFAAPGVPLLPGANVLRAEATDRAGNRAVAEIEVAYRVPEGPRLRAVSGGGQSAPIATELPAPLVVEVLDGAGQPLADAQVVFRVQRGNGRLEGERRQALVRTDLQGRASLRWTLGTRAGLAVDQVQATAVGVAGEAIFSAVSRGAAPHQIDVASGDAQWGAVGTELSRPLFAVVTDGGHNPLPGVPVTFRSTLGGARLVEGGGGESATVDTDASGLASVRVLLGPGAGFDNNLVEAVVEGASLRPATFKASGRIAGGAAETAVSGLVLDNQGAPVPGVTMRVRDSLLSARSDEQGQFRIAGLDPGQLFLIADATTATRPGSWASLEYELFAVSGVENQLPRPIYILPLDLANGKMVDETRGGVVTLPDVPGFALEVAPGSVTFPGGSRSGVVSATLVHADRVPMPPGAGMQPRLIVTIQPVGAHFDPPARLSLPNVDALAPGTVTELFSFDHDIGEFVAIGTGTVSEDGLAVRSDPGFGIVEAGWHCGAPPAGSGSSATLKVEIKEPVDPTQAIGLLVNATQDIVAAGEPPLDAAYSWTIDNPALANLTPNGQASCNGESPVGLCPNAAECTTTARGLAEGKTRVRTRLKCCVSGVQTAEAVRDLLVLRIEVTEVGFVNDHLITEAASGAAIDQPDGTVPVWRRTTNPDKPVAYTKNTPPRLFAKFTVTPSDPATITGVMVRAKAGGTIVGQASGLVIQNGAIEDAGNRDGDVDGIGGGSALPGADAVRKLTPTLQWEVSLDGGRTWGSALSSGPHVVYVTEGAPLLPPFANEDGGIFPPLYDLALEKATTYVDGDPNLAQKITEGIDRDIPYNPGAVIPGHPLNAYTASTGAVCVANALLQRGLMRSVGVDGPVLIKFGGPSTRQWQMYAVPLEDLTGRRCTVSSNATFRVLRAAHDIASPNPHFTYHAVVSYGGRLYDPSYGISYASLNFDETARNSTPQQTSSDLNFFLNVLPPLPATWTCPHPIVVRSCP